MKKQRFSFRSDAAHVLRGFFMGGADIVPGVSGGTVALIAGIYERLVTAISHFDMRLIGELRKRQWATAMQHVDLRFLLALGSGIAGGIIVLGTAIQRLLSSEPTRSLTWATFLGLILGSAIVVGRRVGRTASGHRGGVLAAGLSGAVFAFWLTGLPLQHATPSLGYVFFGGAVAICAMILPGISGAYLLLILGLYAHLTDIIHNLVHGQLQGNDVTTVGVFAAGCAVGLILFSKFLRWLLARHATITMSVLCGFIIGALRRVWPFQHDLTPTAELKEKVFQPYFPERIDGHVLACFAVILLGFLVVAIADHWVQQRVQPPPTAPSQN